MRPRHPDRPRTPGMSLVEIILAVVIASLASVSILRTLRVSRDQYARVDILVTADLLAQSIVEQAIHAFDMEDSRFFELDTPPSTLKQAIDAGRWQEPFLLLVQPRTPVVTPIGIENRYFDPSFGPALPLDRGEGALQRFLADFSYQVDVAFDRATDAGGTGVPIDSDGDGRSEVDVARLTVTVFHEPAGERVDDPIASQHTTYLVVPDKVPGARP